MRCSINIPNLGDFADPRRVADIARLAEEAGSDGLFVWDHLIGYNQELVGEFGATSILLVGSAEPDRPSRPPPPRTPQLACLDRIAFQSQDRAPARKLGVPETAVQ
jgi:hypothetical protein